MPPKVHFYLNSALPHFIQLVTGLEILHQRKEIDLVYSLERREYPYNICRVAYEGKTLIFDLADSSIINEAAFADCDFYIKRMLLRKDFEEREKLIPYGLNFLVFYENSYMRNLIFNRKYFWYGLRYHPTITELLNLKSSIHTAHLKNFHVQPADGFKILFRTRLWNPENNSNDRKKKEREKMNQERIKIIRLMNDRFGNAFEGGIAKDDFSLKQCPELLLSAEEYHKKKYLQMLKKCSIGIANPGLEDSVGWKLGEYVAHGLAILTTPLDRYIFRGGFKEGENYFSFVEATELVEKIEILNNDPAYRKEIQNNNIKYYKDWLEPAAKIRTIFKDIDAY